jgi:Na+/H+ antiporter NhaC
MESNRKPSFIALAPLLIFLVMILGFGLALGSARAVDAMVLFMISAFISIFMYRDKPVMEKFDIFAKGAANPNTMVMIMVFLLAGAFSAVARDGGAVSSVVNLFLTFVPSNFLVPGMFLVACLVATSLGTSVGTIVALTPVAVGVAESTGLPVAMVIGAVLGGAIFGDNMSVISDTTIAATRLCGVKMTDKFKMNFLIVLPAAIITMIIFAVLTSGHNVEFTPGEYNLLQVLPFAVVLVTALSGMNVFFVLLTGIVLAGGVGMYFNTFVTPEGYPQIIGLLQVIQKGMMGMSKVSIIVIIVGGIIGMMKYNGGVDWLVQKLQARVESKKGAMFSNALLTILCTVFIANSTVSIITLAPIQMETTNKFGVDPRRTASYLDIFATAMMSNIPWGPPLLVAAAGASAAMTTGSVDALELIKYSTYSHLVMISAFASIFFGLPNFKFLREEVREEVKLEKNN